MNPLKYLPSFVQLRIDCFKARLCSFSEKNSFENFYFILLFVLVEEWICNHIYVLTLLSIYSSTELYKQQIDSKVYSK